jgi:hypothetical protein
MRKLAGLVGLLALTACGSEEPRFQRSSAAEGSAEAVPEAPVDEGPQPLRVGADGERIFGRELADGVAVTPLATIASNATQYADQVVRTEGTIERVCQRMGCWMELRSENVQPIRVPMAGHSYFLPRSVAGHVAMIEGRVAVQPLTEDMRRHLESEGALATANSLSIEATTVVVR